MSEGCPDPDRFERLLRKECHGPRERLLWEQHLDRCESCRDLVELDQDLYESLAEVLAPKLSTGFEARLQRKLAARNRGARASRLKRRILQGYWVGAVLASLAILEPLGGFSGLLPEATPVVASSALLLLGTAALLARAVRMNLTDLLWRTVLAPRL
jgi:anti-sigma factor RsiW